MRTRPASAAAAFALSTLAVTGLAAPALAQVCDPYSNNCPSVIPTVSDRPTTPPPASIVRDRDEDSTEAATLPFTGGELVLLTAVGAGALAGGTALVLAGRRRKPDAA